MGTPVHFFQKPSHHGAAYPCLPNLHLTSAFQTEDLKGGIWGGGIGGGRLTVPHPAQPPSGEPQASTWDPDFPRQDGRGHSCAAQSRPRATPRIPPLPVLQSRPQGCGGGGRTGRGTVAAAVDDGHSGEDAVLLPAQPATHNRALVPLATGGSRCSIFQTTEPATPFPGRSPTPATRSPRKASCATVQVQSAGLGQRHPRGLCHRTRGPAGTPAVSTETQKW